jgi:hypothetical protein
MIEIPMYRRHFEIQIDMNKKKPQTTPHYIIIKMTKLENKERMIMK